MDDIMEAAERLNKMLLCSPQYKEYINSLEALRGAPAYKEMADNFRKKQVAHEIQKINGEAPEIDELSLANDYADICLITVCNNFFQAEIQLLSLLKGVYETLGQGLEIDV